MKKFLVIRTDKPVDIHNAVSMNTHCCRHYVNVPAIHPVLCNSLLEASTVRNQKEGASIYMGVWEIVELEMEEEHEHGSATS